MKPTFNLIDEPWIPCLMLDGSCQEFGIRHVLSNAHEIAEVYSEKPPITLGLHRLLLAILHRNFGPANVREWVNLWRAERFNADKLDGYFAEKRPLFDLFDPEHPFYQVPRPEETKVDPIQRIMPEISTANNITLFDHNTDDRPIALTPAQAAQYLVALQSTALSSGKGKALVNGRIIEAHTKDAPLSRPFVTLLMGDTLFQTLMLNLVQYDEFNPFQSVSDLPDLPIWEQETPAQYDPDGNIERGYLDWLTWQSRHVTLIPTVLDHGLTIRYCTFLQGLVCRMDDKYMAVADPFLSYVKTQDDLRAPRKLDPQKVVWRDLHTLLQFAEEDKNQKQSIPTVLRWIAKVRRKHPDLLPMRCQIAILGMVTDQADIVLWRHERLPLSMEYLSEPELVNRLKDAITLAEKVAEQALNHAAKTLAGSLLPKANGKVNPKDLKALMAHWQPQGRYWAALEDPFREFLQTLPDDPEGQIASWSQTVKNTARAVLGQLIQDQIGALQALKAAAQAEYVFNRNLKKVCKNIPDLM